jgi:hypothetical protein
MRETLLLKNFPKLLIWAGRQIKLQSTQHGRAYCVLAIEPFYSLFVIS